MKRLCAALGLLGFTLLGCSTGPEPAAALKAPSAARLGAGDSIGLALDRTDRAIAKSAPVRRTLASHPGE